MNCTLLDKPSFTLIGTSIEVSTEHCENMARIPAFWNEISQDGTLEKISTLPNLQGVVGACIMSDPHAKTFTYAAAAMFDTPIEVPSELSRWEVGAHTWAIFEAIGPMPTAIQAVWQQIYDEWFPTSGYQHAPGPELEVYPPGNPSAPDYRCEIWIPVIK